MLQFVLGKNQVAERCRFCIANVIISFVFFFLCSSHCLVLPTRHMGIAGNYAFPWAISLRPRLSLFQCPLWLALRIELVSCSCLLNAKASLYGKLCRRRVERTQAAHRCFDRSGRPSAAHQAVNTAFGMTADSSNRPSSCQSQFRLRLRLSYHSSKERASVHFDLGLPGAELNLQIDLLENP